MPHVRLAALAAAAAALVAACGLGARAGGAPAVERVAVLDEPVALAAAPGEPDRVYVAEKDGVVRVIEDGAVLDEPFLEIRRLVKSTGAEQGLLGLAFHPRYGDNRLFYVNYTAEPDGATRVVEYAAADGGPARRRVVLTVPQPTPVHNGGHLAFGPDGRLWVGMGDGGPQEDPFNRAQDLSTRLGKMLLLEVDAPGSEWEIGAYGLRHPWRYSFDRETGDLYIGDAGQWLWEEVDYLPRARLGRLTNYGWSAFEGTHAFRPTRLDAGSPVAWPVVEHRHGTGGRLAQDTFCTIIGGFVYRGERVPSLRGRYLYGDHCSGHVFSFRIERGEAVDRRREPFGVVALTTFGEDVRGELYLLSLKGGVYRLTSR